MAVRTKVTRQSSFYETCSHMSNERGLLNFAHYFMVGKRIVSNGQYR